MFERYKLLTLKCVQFSIFQNNTGSLLLPKSDFTGFGRLYLRAKEKDKLHILYLQVILLHFFVHLPSTLTQRWIFSNEIGKTSVWFSGKETNRVNNKNMSRVFVLFL